MPITLEANYAKILGLPNCSSHQFTLSVKTDLVSLEQLDLEASRIYQILQTAVDREIQRHGYVPEFDYSRVVSPSTGPNGSSNGSPSSGNAGWLCSPKQRELILTIMEERHIDATEVESICQVQFGKPLRAISRIEASNLITTLLAK